MHSLGVRSEIYTPSISVYVCKVARVYGCLARTLRACYLIFFTWLLLISARQQSREVGFYQISEMSVFWASVGVFRSYPVRVLFIFLCLNAVSWDHFHQPFQGLFASNLLSYILCMVI